MANDYWGIEEACSRDNADELISLINSGSTDHVYKIFRFINKTKEYKPSGLYQRVLPVVLIGKDRSTVRDAYKHFMVGFIGAFDGWLPLKGVSNEWLLDYYDAWHALDNTAEINVHDGLVGNLFHMCTFDDLIPEVALIVKCSYWKDYRNNDYYQNKEDSITTLLTEHHFNQSVLDAALAGLHFALTDYETRINLPKIAFKYAHKILLLLLKSGSDSNGIDLSSLEKSIGF